MTDYGVLWINDTTSCELNERHVMIDNNLNNNDGQKHDLHFRTSLCNSFPPHKCTNVLLPTPTMNIGTTND